MKGSGEKVAANRILRPCKVAEEKGPAREAGRPEREIAQSDVAGKSDQLESFSRCKRIDNLSHVVPGWGCCKCHVYNSYGRKVCKSCGHVPCYPPSEGASDEEA